MLRRRDRQPATPDQRVLFEPLEPRLLLSGDLVFAAVADGDLTLRLDPEDAAVVQVIDDASGAVLSEELLSNLDGESGFAVRIEGAGHDVDLTVDEQVLQSAEIIGSGGVVFDAGSGENTLQGPDASNVWRISGEGSGDLDDGVMRFSGVENVIGGSQADRFVLEQGGRIEGVLDGGLGEDLLTAGDGANNWTITGINEGVLDGRAPIGDEIGQAQSGNVTVGGDDPTVDEFGNILPATGSGGQSFAGMENLGGGAGDDSFVFDSGGLISGVLDGGAGDDTLLAAGRSNVWEIDAQNAGRVNAQEFSGVENLGGSSGSDEFLFADGAMVDGVIDGGAGFNTMDFAAYSGAVALRLLGSSDSAASSGVRNVQRIQGGSSAEDRLRGGDENSTWLIEGRDEGSVGGVQFTGFENLDGGDGRDNFLFSAGGAVSGVVDGGGGFNKLGYSTFGAAVTLDLATGQTTGTGGFQNIQRFVGSAFADTLIGADTTTLWSITSDGTGTANGFQFTGVENLRGGSANDRFLLEGDAEISGSIDGGGGVNTLDYSYHDPGVSADVAAGSATGTGGFSAITDFVGSLGEDTLRGPASDSTWYIDGDNAGHVGDFTFAGIENLAGAADNEDTFVLQESGSLDGVMDGGPRGFDSLIIEGGTYAKVVYRATGPDSGTIDLDDTRITYAGLEPISDNLDVVDRILDYTIVGGDTLTVRDHATAGRIEVISSVSEDIDFVNPTGSLKIITGSDGDTITIEALDAAFDADLIIEAGDDTDIITVEAITGSGTFTVKGEGGADQITLDGLGAGAITVEGGSGDDTYVLKDGWGAATLTEFGGEGNDHLDFSNYTGTLTIAPSGDVTGSDGSTVVYTSEKVESYDGGNVDISSGDPVDVLLDGLAEMVDWARGVAKFGEMASHLPLINKNVEVTAATALDIAEALDRIRLKIWDAQDKGLLNTTDDLVGQLTGFAEATIDHVAPGVFSAAFDPMPNPSGHTFNFGIKINDGSQIDIAVSGATDMFTLRDAINLALEGTAAEGLVGAWISTHEKAEDHADALIPGESRLLFRPFSPDVNDFEIVVDPGDLAATLLGFRTEKIAAAVLQELGDLSVGIAGGVTLDVVIGSGGIPELRLNIDYDADRSTDFDIDLGAEGANEGLSFGGMLSVDSHLDFDFALGLKLDTTPEFFLDVETLRASIDLDASGGLGVLNVGFLGATVSGTASIDAGLELVFDNPADALGLTISDLETLAANPGALAHLELTDNLFTPASSPTMSLSLTVAVDGGLGFTPGAVTIGMVGDNPFAGRDIDLTLSGNFGELSSFKSLSDTSVLGILEQLADWLGNLRESDLFELVNVPFAGKALDGVLDLADAFEDALLFDDGDDGVDGVDNENTIGNDVDKLFEFDSGVNSLVPSFQTAQELAARLTTLGLLDGLAEYVDTDIDGVPDTLLYDINLPDIQLLGFEVPLDFSLDLEPLFDLSSETRIVLDGTAGLNLTLGFDLAAVGGTGLTGGTSLASLGVNVLDKPTMMGDLPARMIVGRLSGTDPDGGGPLTGDAKFDVSLDGGLAETVTVLVTETNTNLTISDLVDDINAAIGLTALAGKVEAEADPDSENGVQLRVIDGAVNDIVVTADSSDPATRELGLPTSASESRDPGEDFVVKPNKSARTVVGRLSTGSDATLTVTIDGDVIPVTVFADYADLQSHDAASNSNILDLVHDVNRALEDAGNGLAAKIAATNQGNYLVLSRIDGSTGSFSIDGTGAAELGLGVHHSSNTDDFVIVVGDELAPEYRIDLSYLPADPDIDDLITYIGTQTDSKVTVSIKLDNPVTPTDESGLGLRLTDDSGGGTREFQVRQINNSQAAQDLGIQLRDRSSSQDTEDGIIDGSTIADAGLLDRFFISTDSEISADFKIQPGRLITDLEVVAANQLTSEDFAFNLQAHNGLDIEIKGVAGFNSGTYTISAVNEGTNTITVSGSAGADVGALSGVGIIQVPIEVGASFGFVGIALKDDLTDGDTSNFTGSISVGLDDAYGATSGRITLGELITGLGELDAMIDGPTFGALGELDLVLEVTPGMALLGGPWDFDIIVNNFGDPYVETTYSGSDFLLVLDSGGPAIKPLEFKLDGDQTGLVRLGAKVTADVDPGPGTQLAEFQVLTVEYNSGDDKTEITLTTDGDDELTTDVTEVIIDTPTLPDITFPDPPTLGDLGGFDDISFDTILDALIAVTDFLGTFENLGFLKDPLPLINKSVSDMLGFVSKLGDAVDAAQASPSGMLQVLESKLEEAVGLSTDDLSDIFTSAGLGAVTDILELDIVEVDGHDVLKFSLNLGAGFSESLNIEIPDLDLGGALQAFLGADNPFFDLTGGAGLEAAGGVAIDFDFGINLDNPTDIYLFDTTNISAYLEASGIDLAFRAAVGPFALAIDNGDASITLGATLDVLPITGGAGLLGFSSGVTLDGTPILDAIDLSVDSGTVTVNLPVYFPTDQNFIADITANASVASFFSGSKGLEDIFDLDDVIAGILDFNFDQLSLFDSIYLVIDGVDMFMETMQGVLDGEVFGVSIPFVGKELSKAADFIGDMRSDFIAPLRTNVEKAGDFVRDVGDPDDNFLSKLIYDLIGPDGDAGIQLLFNDGGPTGSPSDFIDLDTNLDEYLLDPGGDIDFDDTYIEWEMSLGQHLLDLDTDIGFDLGIPGLGLKTEGNVQIQLSWELLIGFGISFKDGFYLIIDKTNPELVVDFSIDMPVTVTGVLGFLEISAGDNGTTGANATFQVDVSNESDANDEKIGFSEFGNLDFDAGLSASAVADLAFTLAFGGVIPESVASGFPSIKTDFYYDWSIGARSKAPTSSLLELAQISEFESLDNIENGIAHGLKTVDFSDIGLDLGSYISDVLGPIVKEVQKITGPIQPLIDVLTARIPVISDLAGQTITLIDLAAQFGSVDPGMIMSIAEIITLVNRIPTDSPEFLLPIGNFTPFKSDGKGQDFMPALWDARTDSTEIIEALLLPENESLVRLTIEEAGGFQRYAEQNRGIADSLDFLSGLNDGSEASGFSLPILTDTTQVFNLIMGKDAVLVAYDMEPLEFEFEWSMFFSIFGPLGVSINAGIGVTIDLAFGYDTYGIRRFVEGDFRNPLLLFEGFYISDTDLPTGEGTDVPEVVVSGEVSAAAEINLVVAKAGVAGGIGLNIDFDLNDPDGDGRVRITEIVGNVVNQIKSDEPALAPLAMFDVHGEIFAKLYAFLSVDLFLFSIDEEWDITPPITLAEFDLEFSRPPKYATELAGGSKGSGNDDLLINLGESSKDRLRQDTTDGDETVTITQTGATSVDVVVDGLGYPAQSYDIDSNGTIIVAAGEGNDTININLLANSDLQVEIEAGPGNDTINITGANGSGSHGATIYGGLGDDTITSAGGDDIIIGDQGHDVIDGGGGTDIVLGDNPTLSDNSVRGKASPLDGNDSLSGGADADIIIGSGGADTIAGGGGDDFILADGGRVIFTSKAVPFIAANVSEVTDTEGGLDSYADVIDGGDGDDTIWAGKGNDTIAGGANDDRIYGQRGFDEIDGDDGDDLIFGDNGKYDDVVLMAWRATAGGDADTIRGGTGDDTIFAGDGADYVQGDEDDDVIWGGPGADELHGERPTLTGSGGADAIFGEGGPDEIYGGNNPVSARDTLDGGAGNDIVFGDSGKKNYWPTTNPLPVSIGGGNDFIYSGQGDDIVDGQGGSDSYYFTMKGGDKEAWILAYDSGILAGDSDLVDVTGTVWDDQFLLRSSGNEDNPDVYGFVAMLNTEYDVERINYRGMERLIVKGSVGDDRFHVDDAWAAVTLDGGVGHDFFQIGQLYRSQRDPVQANVATGDIIATIPVTRGWLSPGVTEPLTAHGGVGEDEFVVFHNLNVLTLNGGDGDDEFTVRAFALRGSTENERDRTDISGGEGADFVQYAVNAPVNIDGGDGFDRLRVIGTEFGDDFVITPEGVYGAGLNVNFVNIESLVVDGAEGDDRFYVVGTSEKFVTEIAGGLGNDTFDLGGDAPPVTSNDLLGHSGVISHGVEVIDPMADPDWVDLKVIGISANVADNEEPGIRITPSDGATYVTEEAAGGFYDTYTIVLTRNPGSKEVWVQAQAPLQTEQEEQMGAKTFMVTSPTDMSPTPSDDGSYVSLKFTSGDWSTPQTVEVMALGNADDRLDYDDDAIEGLRYGVISHIVTQESFLPVNPSPEIVDGATFTDTDVFFPSAIIGVNEGLRGRILEIIDGPGAGQSRQILSSSVNTLTLSTFSGVNWDTPLVPGESIYRIRMYETMAVPGVLVRINDDDAPGIKVNNLNNDERIDVIEGGQTDTLSVQLTRLPTSPVTVNLDPGGQLELSDTALNFDVGDWNAKQYVTVNAADDDVREGFHHGATFFTLDATGGTPDVDIFMSVTNEEFDLRPNPSEEDPLAGPSAFVGLAHKPVLDDPGHPIRVYVDPDGLGPEAEVERTSFEVISNVIVFVDGDGDPEMIEGVIRVEYDWISPGYDGYIVEPVVADIADNDYPGVLIRQTDGSTDVIEGAVFGDPEPWTDSYTVVLTQQPTNDIKVTVTPEVTKTSRAPEIQHYTNKQVIVQSPTGVNNIPEGTTMLTFTHGNWDSPQTVYVYPRYDAVVDGGDTKVFAPSLHTLSEIQGPLFVHGAGGDGSLAGLNNPVMLPIGADGENPETNVKPATGDVESITETTVTVSTAELLASPLITTLSDLFEKTVEITEGPDAGLGIFRLIVGHIENGSETTLVLNEAWGLTPSELSQVTKYALTKESLNFFVKEEEQVDWMRAFNDDSVADGVGTLTSYSLTGLGMGPDLYIGDRWIPGGITHDELEVAFVKLGFGNDDFTISGTPNRPDDFQTWTFIETGENFVTDPDPHDKVTVILNDEDVILASGTADAETEKDTLADAAASFATAGDGLKGYLVRITGGTGMDQVRRIWSNTGTELTLFDDWKITPDETSTYEVFDAKDGAISIDLQGDDDFLDARQSSVGVTAFGDVGDDTIYGGTGDDLIFGDRGRVNYIDENGAIVTRLGMFPEPITGDVASSGVAELTVVGNPFPVTDEGLVGLWVRITGGTGVGQLRLITANTSNQLTVSEEWDIAPDGTSLFRVNTLPQDQTDGVRREPTLEFSIDPGVGGSDLIYGNEGNDTIFGGAGDDEIHGDWDAADPGDPGVTGNDLIFGDSGQLEFSLTYPEADPKFGEEAPTDLDHVTSTHLDVGGDDTLAGSAGSDTLIGGAGSDTMYGDGTTPSTEDDLGDLLLGDSGELVYNDPVIDPDPVTLDVVRTIGTEIGAGDTMFGNRADDTLLGGVGGDWIEGNENDDLAFGDYGILLLAGGVAVDVQTTDRTLGGTDTMSGGLHEDILVGGAFADVIDGDAGDDLIFGDNVRLARLSGFGDTTNERFRALTGTLIYDMQGADNVEMSAQYANPDNVPVWVDWNITLFDHSLADEDAGLNNFGGDYIAGGADDDTIFAQLGNDVVQGDGAIEGKLGGNPVEAYRAVDGTLFVVPSFEAASDGDDYIEGNGGDDTIFGNLGQDDIIGGSSDQFSLDTADKRPDGADLLFGGAGTDIARGDMGDQSDEGHARDADVILGDNGNIFRLVGTNGSGTGAYLSFNYDDYSASLKIVPRAVELLDYTPGGADYDAANAATDIGAADEVHGESGDDFVYGMLGGDTLFGEGQDDDIVGGYGLDWIASGSGDDGVLGDDGRIYTSRNSTAGEPLYGIEGLASNELDDVIRTPGNKQTAVINVTGELKKTVNLEPFFLAPLGTAFDPYHDPVDADDIIYGGYGNDFLHGGSGDDAMSGAEALPEFYAVPYNAGDVLQHGLNRPAEFAAYNEYDPWAKIKVDGSGVFTTDGSGFEFLLNFEEQEGELIDGDAAKPIWSDGADRIFGDLGNDWIVGGTGRDNLYGGFGDDLLNADDDHDTTEGTATPLANNEPDTHATYEDRAYGGGGRDVLIANTGGDRLIDWAGEFNSYVVPFAPFGAATVSRSLQPQLREFLYDLSEADGADPTRADDTGQNSDRNGEPYGEMGLVSQQDPWWGDQTGGPDDPQPGNIGGGKRDVLRSADYEQGQAESMLTESGIGSSTRGRYEIAPGLPGQDAISLFDLDEIFPRYVEMEATIQADRGKIGFGSNAFVIFDYYDVRDFKFAGIDTVTGNLVLGHRGFNGWVVDAELGVEARPDVDYDLKVEMNDDRVTAYLDDSYQVNFTFQRRMVGGQSYGVTTGMLGVGAENSVARFDDLEVQVLPRPISMDDTDAFDGTDDGLLNGERAGEWALSDGRFNGMPEPGTDFAVSLVDVGLSHGVNQASILELNGTLATAGTGGYIFDRYDANDFKFATLDAVNGQVLIGHHTEHDGWVVDASVSATIQEGKDHDLEVTLRGRNVSIDLDGVTVLEHDFNGLVLDGEFGLLAAEGQTSFEEFNVRSDDPALLTPAAPAPDPEIAEPGTTPVGGDDGLPDDFAALGGGSSTTEAPAPHDETGVIETTEPVADPVVEKTTWTGAVDPFLDERQPLDDLDDDERAAALPEAETVATPAEEPLPGDWVVEIGVTRTEASSVESDGTETTGDEPAVDLDALDRAAAAGMKNDWLIDTEKRRGPRRGR